MRLNNLQASDGGFIKAILNDLALGADAAGDAGDDGNGSVASAGGCLAGVVGKGEGSEGEKVPKVEDETVEEEENKH